MMVAISTITSRKSPSEDDLFDSTRPLAFAGGDENLRRYVGNHPTYATDPSGLHEVTIEIGGRYVKIDMNCVDVDKQEIILKAFHNAFTLAKRIHDKMTDGSITKDSPQVTKWFGDLTDAQFAKVKAVFSKVWDATDEKKLVGLDVDPRPKLRLRYNPKDEPGIYCSNARFGIPRVGGFQLVTVTFHPDCFTFLDSAREQAAHYFHELTHVWAGTEDYGYWNNTAGEYRDSRNRPITLTTDQLIKNANTYERFFLEFWE